MLKKISLALALLSGLFATQTYFTDRASQNSLLIPIDNLNDEELDKFYLGKSFFRIPWVEAPSATTARDGLGALFNANSCTSCHKKNGEGDVYNKNGFTSRSLVVRLSIDSNKSEYRDVLEKDGFIPEPNYGSQLSINSVHGVKPEGKAEVKYQKIDIKLSENETVILNKPIVSLKNLNYGELNKSTNISLRKAPALIGLGLIELISDREILKNVDEFDKNSDGISGKANYIYSKESNKTELGRYTYKASSSSIKLQSALALHNDMGLTTDILPFENCTKSQKACLNAPKGVDIDVPNHRLEAIEFYLTNLKTYRAKETKEFRENRELFNKIGCVKCHVDSFETKKGFKIAPYSDFLLHDMGEGLSDGRSEFLAEKNEWRTTPLWGISIRKKLKKNLTYLHDGRAKSLKEAILWHGGEAEASKEAFKNLPKVKREKIIKFLGEL